MAGLELPAVWRIVIVNAVVGPTFLVLGTLRMPTWRNRIICLFFIGLVSLAAQLHARDPMQVAAEIDQHLNRNIEKQGFQPGPIADDAEFLRRAYLDITVGFQQLKKRLRSGRYRE